MTVLSELYLTQPVSDGYNDITMHAVVLYGTPHHRPHVSDADVRSSVRHVIATNG